MSSSPYSALGLIKGKEEQQSATQGTTQEAQKPLPDNIDYILQSLASLKPVEKAIVASILLNEDSPIAKLGIEDWYEYLKEKLGERIADAFKKWAEGHKHGQG